MKNLILPNNQFLKKIKYGSLLFIVVLAYLVPMDVLDRCPQFVPFVDFMASWNLQVRRVGEFTGPASQVNMFVYSMAWCLIPIPMVCEYFNVLRSNKEKNYSPADHPIIILLGVIFMGALSAWVVLAWPGQNWPIGARVGGFIFLSPITRPILSIGMVYLAAWFAMVGVTLLWAIVVKVFRRFKD